MATHRQVSSSLSNSLVDWLVKERGMNQEQIAGLLEVSSAFVSRVRSGERRLTVDHLEMAARALDLPLGAMLLAAVPDRPDRPETRAIRKLVERMLTNADEAKASLKRVRSERGSPAGRA